MSKQPTQQTLPLSVCNILFDMDIDSVPMYVPIGGGKMVPARYPGKDKELELTSEDIYNICEGFIIEVVSRTDTQICIVYKGYDHHLEPITHATIEFSNNVGNVVGMTHDYRMTKYGGYRDGGKRCFHNINGPIRGCLDESNKRILRSAPWDLSETVP
uniref:Uncharacterized protein n=1 Tax=viral metagenome TaxID=1070528 RepID=A0A6C0J5L4_9ZZZZ